MFSFSLSFTLYIHWLQWPVSNYYTLFISSEVLDVFCAIEISVKWGKDNTSTLSLVIHRVRFKKKKKNLQKTTLAFKGMGGETQKTINFDGSSVSPCLSFFLRASTACYIHFRCSYLYSYYNSSRTFWIKCWDSAFRTEFQHLILRFNKISLLYRERPLKERG
jgi:hypothetical protein